MTEPNPGVSTQLYRTAARKFYWTIPVHLAVPMVFWGMFVRFGVPMHWQAFAVGVMGWLVAMLMRGPIAALVRKWPEDRATRVMGAASGPLEECVRAIALFAVGRSFDIAASLGQGWAFVEVLLTIVNGAVLIQVLNRSDEKAEQVKQILQNSGQLSASPLLGVVERIFASAYHIGSTLLIARSLWLVILMIPVHSLFNLTTARLGKKSILAAEACVTVTGVVVFVSGVYASGM